MDRQYTVIGNLLDEITNTVRDTMIDVNEAERHVYFIFKIFKYLH